jgi:hypothetical protein
MATTRSGLHITILHARGRDTSLQRVRGHIIRRGAIVRSIVRFKVKWRDNRVVAKARGT